MKDNNINWELITSLLRGEKLSDEELNIVLAQIKEYPELIKNAEELLFIIQKVRYAREANQINLQNNWIKVNSKIKYTNRKKTITYTLRIAATIIILLSFSFYFFILRNDFFLNSKDDQYLTQLIQRQIDSADLLLIRSTDTIPILIGDDFFLDKVHLKYVTQEDGFSFETPEESESEYTVNIPNGKQAKITLDDGSVVWLNSTSTLEYPLVFNKPDREVNLIGEGLFDVVSNTEKRFVVNTANNTKVIVHGTLFNVKSYEEEDKIVTTLIHGSVGFEMPDGKEEALLPGNQGIYYKSGKVYENKTNVDVLYFTKWKEGIYLFQNEELKNIALQLERWYGVKIILMDNLATKKLSGGIELEKPLSSFLINIEKTINIKYEAYEKTIRITEK